MGGEGDRRRGAAALRDAGMPYPSGIHPPTPAVSAAAPLGADQQCAYDLAMAGANLLISGPAGTGKSFLLSRIVADLRGQGRRVAVTASTGVAALNVGGGTIHSYLGTQLCGSIADLKAAKLYPNAKALDRLTGLDVLVVDEVSMLTGDYLDMAEGWVRVARERGRRRKDARPFGGVQVVLCGDFLQLPPVQMRSAKIARLHAFEAECWPALGVGSALLRDNFRQGDGEFVRHLLDLREGRVTDEARDFFRPCVHRQLRDATQLVPHNATAARINADNLAKLPGRAQQFDAVLSGDPRFYEPLKERTIAEPTLVLKRGAPVILLKNDRELGIANGMRGRVAEAGPGVLRVRLSARRVVSLTPAKWEMRDADDPNKVLATMHQYPAKLAWALTIHKSQGMTLDRVRCSLDGVFETGHAYVALSRVRRVGGLALDDYITPRQFLASDAAVRFYRGA